MTQIKSLEHDLLPDLLVEPSQIERILSPYMGRSLSTEEWSKIQDEEFTRLQTYLRKHKWLRWIPGALRSQKSIKFNYDAQWINFEAEDQVSKLGKLVPLEWGNRYFMARAVATKRIHLLHLMKIIEITGPNSILEVGAGNGLNLIELAAYFDDKKFTGLELTPGGVNASIRLASKLPLPNSIIEFSPLPLTKKNVVGRINFNIGNAAKMPFEETSFDLVYTSLALEQMEEVRDGALREIARVAKKWVVMIEPWRDFNNFGVRASYIDANRYFSGFIDDLPTYGLIPVRVIQDVPNKINLKVAIVVAQKL